MIIKSTSRWVIAIVLGWTFSISTVNAALIFTTPPDPVPDTQAWNAIDYVYTNGTTNAAGFDMTITGSTVGGLNVGSNIATVSGTCDYGFGCYSLSAHFNSAGIFSSGSISLSYTGNIDVYGDGSAILSSGNLLTGSLTNFGFASISPHSGSSGIFQYTFNTTGGDYMTFFSGADGGSELNINDLLFSLTSGTWDNVNGSGMTLLQMEFSSGDWGCGSNCLTGGTVSDTFIPVPAAVWLFGSGLLALAGVARRRRVH